MGTLPGRGLERMKEKNGAVALLEGVQEARAEKERCFHYLEELRDERRRMEDCGGRERDAVLAELADREAELCRRTSAYWGKLRAAEALVCALPDARSRAVLRLRYLDGLRWPRVAEEMCRNGFYYEERQVYRLHTRALREAETTLSACKTGGAAV